jgi:hypothetical protein
LLQLIRSHELPDVLRQDDLGDATNRTLVQVEMDNLGVNEGSCARHCQASSVKQQLTQCSPGKLDDHEFETHFSTRLVEAISDLVLLAAVRFAVKDRMELDIAPRVRPIWRSKHTITQIDLDVIAHDVSMLFSSERNTNT